MDEEDDLEMTGEEEEQPWESAFEDGEIPSLDPNDVRLQCLERTLLYVHVHQLCCDAM